MPGLDKSSGEGCRGGAREGPQADWAGEGETEVSGDRGPSWEGTPVTEQVFSSGVACRCLGLLDAVPG